jgi:hypothetical protein
MLDEAVVPGYAVNNVLIQFSVSNNGKFFDGGAAVPDMDFVMEFPDPLKDGDMIQIVGPRNFNVQGNFETKACNSFAYVGTNPLPTTGDPKCFWEQAFTRMVWQIAENKDPAFPQNQPIRFKAGTVNPAKTPDVTNNYWTVQHKRGNVIRSSHVSLSWQINPQLRLVDISIVGSKLAAGAVSELLVKFTTVSKADTMKLEALFPTQFDFGQAQVGQGQVADTTGNTIIVNRLNMAAGTAMELKINSVRLGRSGGQNQIQYHHVHGRNTSGEG